MNISERSWHYRLYRYYATDLGMPGRKYKEPTNLCRYFWSLVGHTLLFGVVGVVFLVVVVVGAIFLAIATAIAFVRRRPMPWHDEAKKERLRKEEEEWQPGLVRSYLAAKKARVCPLITVEKEER